MALTEVSSNKSFGGFQKVFEHTSMQLGCKMKFGIYLPPKAEQQKCPILYWLSGLTCTEQNFVTKAGAQKLASEFGIIVVAPDTSPRGCAVPGEDENWDLGTGAGFYVDATQEPWSKHYRMYSYITAELPTVLQKSFPVLPDKQSIMGHSMGGHGALVCCLRNPGLYKSVSAFAPICNPVQCPWGHKAFQNYLGADQDAWKIYLDERRMAIIQSWKKRQEELTRKKTEHGVDSPSLHTLQRGYTGPNIQGGGEGARMAKIGGGVAMQCDGMCGCISEAYSTSRQILSGISGTPAASNSISFRAKYMGQPAPP
uniref:S-formylglutathione hydrolase n=1 Tax=Eptatretus burgeri TaxID=7764 RepID=A0A8C4WPF6_EPTBU